MVTWPKHNETIRDDELFLFAYCSHRWSDCPYDQRSPLHYSDIVNRLNTVFGDRYGVYTADGIELYVRRVRTDPKYRWPANNRKRYNQFASEIKQYRAIHHSELGPGGLPRRPIDISMKGMY